MLAVGFIVSVFGRGMVVCLVLLLSFDPLRKVEIYVLYVLFFTRIITKQRNKENSSNLSSLSFAGKKLS